MRWRAPIAVAANRRAHGGSTSIRLLALTRDEVVDPEVYAQFIVHPKHERLLGVTIHDTPSSLRDQGPLRNPPPGSVPASPRAAAPRVLRGIWLALSPRRVGPAPLSPADLACGLSG